MCVRVCTFKCTVRRTHELELILSEMTSRAVTGSNVQKAQQITVLCFCPKGTPNDRKQIAALSEVLQVRTTPHRTAPSAAKYLRGTKINMRILWFCHHHHGDM
jgi:hypothetical protein